MNKIRKLIILAIVGLFFGAGGMPSLTGHQQNNDDAQLPIWEIGDSWTYDVFMNGGIDEKLELDDLHFSELEFMVTTIGGDEYQLDLSAELFGDVEVEMDAGKISGGLQDATMSGTLFIDKTTLSFQRITNLNIEGFVKPYRLPKISFEMQGSVDFSYETSALDFPIELNENWTVPESVITLDASVKVFGQTISLDELKIFVEEHESETVGWEDISLGGIDYHAIKTDNKIGAEHEIWYCPGVGNIVKIESESLPLSWGGHGYYDISMELVSTTYPDPPNEPEMPTGDSTVEAGEMGEYTSRATDPGNNNIRYIFNWGDGSESSTSDFVSSGDEITMSHQWNTEGSFDVRVQAQNVYGAVSDWSESITVTVLNDPPKKPEKPDGPNSGKAMESYTYSTSSSDPEEHKIRYGWDWDGDKTVDQWTNYYFSGSTATASHVWNDQGTYDIRVIAQDEHGGESDWSDPLSVSMPKSKNDDSLLSYIRSFFKAEGSLVSSLDFITKLKSWLSITPLSIFESSSISTHEEVDTINVDDDCIPIEHFNNEVSLLGTEDSWVSIISPDGGENYEDEVQIIWSLYYPFDCLPLFDIYYAKQGGSPILLSSNLESPINEGSLYINWDASGLHGQYRIRIDMKHCDGGGVVASDTSDDWFFIGSNTPPDACYTCSNLNPDVGQTVQFDGSCSSDSDGSITDYYWYYTIEGGGLPVTMGHGKTLSYNWDEAGIYQVTLEVTDNSDIKDQETKTINVGGGGEADLDCQGSLSWTNTKPGELVTASFSVINVGESGSQLNWKIQSFPSWGDWTLTPNSGKGLTPADGSMMVEVFVVAPEVEESAFSGEILVINEDDSSDYETISVSLSTPKDRGNEYRFLYQLRDMFQFLIREKLILRR